MDGAQPLSPGALLTIHGDKLPISVTNRRLLVIVSLHNNKSQQRQTSCLSKLHLSAGEMLPKSSIIAGHRKRTITPHIHRKKLSISRNLIRRCKSKIQSQLESSPRLSLRKNVRWRSGVSRPRSQRWSARRSRRRRNGRRSSLWRQNKDFRKKRKRGLSEKLLKKFKKGLWHNWGRFKSDRSVKEPMRCVRFVRWHYSRRMEMKFSP